MIEARLHLRDRIVSWGSARPLLMAVVNANPDSFSDPGPRTIDAVTARARALVDEGAAIVDVGAQSAITGRPPVDPEDEAAAVVPVIEALLDACPDVLVSVDTFKPAVAAAALAAGAHLINDVSGLRDRTLARLCAAYGAGLVVMHTSGPPLTRLQDASAYEPGGVAEQVAAFLRERVAVVLEEGVARESVVVDPGVDFTKTPAQTVELLRDIQAVVALGHPVLLALSRKDFVGALTGRPPSGRLAGTLGAAAALRHVPGQILRVHDVGAVRDFLTVLDAVDGAAPVDPNLLLPEELRHEPR